MPEIFGPLVCYIHVQVIQYEEIAGTWSEIGKMKKARYYHSVVEIDVSLCPGIVGQTNKIKFNYVGTSGCLT